MATPGERALSVLHQLRERRRLAAVRSPAGPEDEGRFAGTVGALLAVGLLSEEEAQDVLGESDEEPTVFDSAAREEGARLLAGLLDAVVREGDEEGMARHRFAGALEALAGVGVADAEEWDQRLRERTGRPSAEEEWELVLVLNAGGTEQNLVAVVPGSVEAVDGLVVLHALRFADGISFTCARVRESESESAVPEPRRRDAWDWKLRDDAGTEYRAKGLSTSDRDVHMQFMTAPPSDASWVELVSPLGNAIRLAL